MEDVTRAREQHGNKWHREINAKYWNDLAFRRFRSCTICVYVSVLIYNDPTKCFLAKSPVHKDAHDLIYREHFINFPPSRLILF